MLDIFRDLENEIVFIKKEDVFTDSKTIAKEFGRRHGNITRLIKECISDLQSIESQHELTFELMKNKINTGTTAKRDSEYYILNRDAFMFFIMKVHGKKADEFKIKFINAFNAMEQWIKDRAVGRSVRLSMTDSIRNYIPETQNKKFKYKHFTDLIYKKVLGKTKKQIDEELGYKVENLRDICTDDQLNKFCEYENEISVLIKYGKDYGEIKKILK